MDYEKKYNEALSKCKAYINDTEKRWSEEFSRATEEIFKEIFPELRESEDERIRKKLIEVVRYFRSRGIDQQTCEEFLTYLEKQKEQKLAHTAKEMWKEMRLEVYAQASGNRHEPNYSDDSTKMFSLCDIDEIFEKIGNSTVEPQPAEWSEGIIRKPLKKSG